MKACLYLIALPVVFLYFGCESMMQEIDVEPANLPPMLAITATLDTGNGGTLMLCFTEGRSIGSYRNGRPENETIVRNGEITLYEDDRIIFSIENGVFDLSLRGTQSGYSEEIQQIGPLKAGSTYRLELDIEGYPAAKASVVMPEAPAIESLAWDTDHPVFKKHLYEVPSIEFGSGSIDPGGDGQAFIPMTVRLADNSAGRNYYLIKTYRTYTGDGYHGYDAVSVGVGSNHALIQDNPDMEANSLFLDNEPDVFLFRHLLISDMSFSNTTGTLDLLLSKDLFYDNKDLTPCDNSQQIHHRTEIVISHISPAAYLYYRSMALQYQGVGFFTEPVSIASNFENAYGCFSVTNTVSTLLDENYFCPTYTGDY